MDVMRHSVMRLAEVCMIDGRFMSRSQRLVGIRMGKSWIKLRRVVVLPILTGNLAHMFKVRFLPGVLRDGLIKVSVGPWRLALRALRGSRCRSKGDFELIERGVFLAGGWPTMGLVLSRSLRANRLLLRRLLSSSWRTRSLLARRLRLRIILRRSWCHARSNPWRRSLGGLYGPQRRRRSRQGLFFNERLFKGFFKGHFEWLNVSPADRLLGGHVLPSRLLAKLLPLTGLLLKRSLSGPRRGLLGGLSRA